MSTATTQQPNLIDTARRDVANAKELLSELNIFRLRHPFMSPKNERNNVMATLLHGSDLIADERLREYWKVINDVCDGFHR